ncbi:Ricin B-type lectin domain-containing protein [Aphelenchoides besseyi]|nr:Ricin B-type lectin domain-containing protein [Aphelenchoides besseyi]
MTVEISDIFVVFSSLDIDRLVNSKFFGFLKSWWSWISCLNFKEFQVFNVSVRFDRSDLCLYDQFKRLNSSSSLENTEVLYVNEIFLSELDDFGDEFYDALEFPAIDLNSQLPIEIKIIGMQFPYHTRESNCVDSHPTSTIYNLSCQLSLNTNITSRNYEDEVTSTQTNLQIFQLLDICVQFFASNQQLGCLQVANINLEVDDEIKVTINSVELKDLEKKQLIALNKLIMKIDQKLELEFRNTTISCDLSALKRDPTDKFVFVNNLICKLNGNITFDVVQLEMLSDLNIEEVLIGQSNSILDQPFELRCIVQRNKQTHGLSFVGNTLLLHLPMELLDELLKIDFTVVSELLFFLKNLINIDQMVSQILEINLVIGNNQKANFVRMIINDFKLTGMEIETDCLVDLFNTRDDYWEPLIEKFGVSVSIDWTGKIAIESAVNQPINLTLTSWYIEEIYELSRQSSFLFPTVDVEFRSSIGISIVDETREELVYAHLKDLRLETKCEDRNLQMSITMGSIQIDNQMLWADRWEFVYCAVDSELPTFVDPAIRLELFVDLTSFHFNVNKLPGISLEHSIWSFDHLELTLGLITVSVVTVPTNSLPTNLKQLKQAVGLPLVSFEDATIRLSTFRLLKFVGSLNQLVNMIAEFYCFEIQKQILKIAGSTDMLGSPSALVRDLNHGLNGLLQNGDVRIFVFDVTHGLTNSIAKVTHDEC